MKIFNNLLFFILLASCGSKINSKKEIELKLLTPNFKAYCIDNTCSKDVLFTDENYDNYFTKSTNIVKFNIKNNSNSKVAVLLDGLPKSSKFRALFLGDLQVKEIKSSKRILATSAGISCFNNPFDLLDSSRINIYKKTGYNKSYTWYLNNGIIENSLIFLEPNEVKYFELYVNLPYNSPINSCVFEYFKLNKNKNYDVRLYFKSDTTNIKKHLTWSQLKNIEENNYKLFHGTILSENAVPIVFVE